MTHTSNAKRTVQFPLGSPPPAAAPVAERIAYATPIVALYIAATGGEADLPDVPAGHRFRTELALCVEDPVRYVEWIKQELEGESN